MSLTLVYPSLSTFFLTSCSLSFIAPDELPDEPVAEVFGASVEVDGLVLGIDVVGLVVPGVADGLEPVWAKTRVDEARTMAAVKVAVRNNDMKFLL